MQRWFPHSNWVDVQNLSAREGKESSAFWRNDLIYPNRNSCFPCAVGSLKKNTLVCFVFSRERNGSRIKLWSRLTTVSLISSVLTVIFLITCPAHRNAATTGTSKEVDWTFKFPLICKTTKKTMLHFWQFKILEKARHVRGETKHPTWAVSLIGKVSTVIVAVTHP